MAGDMLGCHLALMGRLVGQHRITRNIANRINRRIGCLHVFVDLDESARTDFDICVLKARDGRVRRTSDGYQNLFEDPLAFLHRGAGKGDAHPLRFLLNAGNRSVEHDGIEDLLHAPLQWSDQVAIGAGQQAGQHFHHGDLGSQRRIDGAKFQTNVPAAHNQHGLGNIQQGQGAGGVEDTWAGNVERRNRRRTRTGGDDNAVEGAIIGRTSYGFYLQSIGVLEAGATLNVLDLAQARQLSQPAGQLLHHAFLPGAKAGNVDLGFAELDAPILGVA